MRISFLYSVETWCMKEAAVQLLQMIVSFLLLMTVRRSGGACSTVIWSSQPSFVDHKIGRAHV